MGFLLNSLLLIHFTTVAITNGHLLFVMGALILEKFKNAKLDK